LNPFSLIGGSILGFEVDFLWVGEESCSGDAIALRYGNLQGFRHEQTVVIIDGGFAETGQRLVDHLLKYYGTDEVDLVIATHMDADHVGGLLVALPQLNVGELWMHRAWRHSTSLAEARGSGFKNLNIAESVKKSLQEASELEVLAEKLSIPIREPFQGLTSSDGSLVVLGPTEAYYEELIREISGGQPETTAQMLLRKLSGGIQKLVPESLWIETLSDNVETRPQNNTSAICLLEADGQRMLFTGDAGIPALEIAADALAVLGVQTGGLNFVQIPHHGSRRNVGPTILNRLLGEPGSPLSGVSIVSAAKNGAPKHPSKKVTNAFVRRGYTVVSTVGRSICHRHDAPDRSDYGPASPLPLYPEVEDD
jgi:beta-lactamase superfamily II metal-dependent hydrolase